MLLRNVRVNVERSEQGDWVEGIHDMEDLRLKVRAQGNKAWRLAYAKHYDALPREMRLLTRLPPEEQDKLNATVMLEAGLLDWENFNDETTGDPIPYSKEKAKELLFDPQYRPFLTACIWACSWLATQTGTAKEHAEGN